MAQTTDSSAALLASRAALVWAALAVGLATWVFFPILVWDTDPDLFSLAELWMSDDNYSYGFLIPPLAAYFVWEKRYELQELPAEGSRWGLLLIAAAFGCFFVGMLGGINYLPRLSAVVLLYGGVLWVGGRAWARELAFPIGFLILMIPFPRFAMIQISFPLQVFAAEMAELALLAINVPILRTGNVIHLAHTQLEVAEACSGLRSLLALITTGVVFAYFFGNTLAQRLIVVFMSVPIAIFVNALRVAGTSWLAHNFGADVATGFYHTLEGFGMFGVAFVLLAIVGFTSSRLLPAPEETA